MKFWFFQTGTAWMRRFFQSVRADGAIMTDQAPATNAFRILGEDFLILPMNIYKVSKLYYYYKE